LLLDSTENDYSHLKGTMLNELRLPRLIKRLEQACRGFPDLRTGKNSVYELVDVGMSAFSVFFTQSPSFLAHQRDLKLRKGRAVMPKACFI
jgi:hypothetical protein